MHLITPLSAGVKGAENGTARVYRRGTTTRATVYHDFEGFVPDASGTDIQLDANGGAELYVNELVTVDVRDSLGATIREFVAGVASPAVEVRSESFTGTSYDDGSGVTVTDPDQPTTLQEIADLWKTQNESIDWKVLVLGASKTIKDALDAVSGMFVNVKDPAYGAVGDGSTDDKGAIEAAIAAAFAMGPGAIVFFPPGQYRVNGMVQLEDGVSLWGSGPSATKILQAHASQNLLETSASTLTGREGFDEIKNMTLGAAAATTGAMCRVRVSNVRFSNVKFGGEDANSSLLISDSVCKIDTHQCEFDVRGASASAVICNNSGAYYRSNGDEFKLPATYNGTVLFVSGFHMDGSIFRNGSVTTGSFEDITHAEGLDSFVHDSVFELQGGSSSCTGISLLPLGSSQVFDEWSNYFPSGFKAYDYSSSTNWQKVLLGTRERRNAQVVDHVTSTPAVPSDEFANYTFIRDGTTNVTFQLSPQVPLGGTFRITVINRDSGTFNASFGGSPMVSQAHSTTIGAVKVVTFTFVGRARASTGDPFWYLVSLEDGEDV